MARERSPDREKAEKKYLDSSGQLKLKDIAADLNVSPEQIRKWKSIDKWDDKLNSNVTIEKGTPKGNVTKRKSGAQKGNKHAVGNNGGAPPGNKNAIGNRGGDGGPPGNDKAVKHGFFKRIFPDDDETQAIIAEIDVKSPVEILWENIVIQYTAIARSQRIMFVKDQDDQTKVTRKVMDMESGSMTEWEYQHAWDKQAKFLAAQSRAIHTLEGLLSRYEEMLAADLKAEKQQLELAKMRAELTKLKGDKGDSGSGNIDQLADVIVKSAAAIQGGA